MDPQPDRHLSEQSEILGQRSGELSFFGYPLQLREHAAPELAETGAFSIPLEQRLPELRFERANAF